MSDIEAVTSGLTLGADGIWYSELPERVSYPESGHLESAALLQKSFWYSHRNRILLATIKRHSPSGTLFDVGGGTGVVSAFLQQNGIDVALVEPGQDGASTAKAMGVSKVICGTTTSAGFRADSLPAIGVFDVVEHIEDDVGFLEHLNSLLVMGGAFYATVPAYRWLWSSDDVYAGHFRRYTKAGFTRKLRATGFEIDYASYFFWPLPLPILLLRALPSLLNAKRGHDAARIAREHGEGDNSSGLLARALQSELGFVQRGRSIPAGSSILVATRKIR